VSLNGPDNAGDVLITDEYGFTQRTIRPGNNEGIAFTLGGHLMQAGDGINGPSVRTFCTPAMRPNGATYDPNVDRSLRGANTTLNMPKGMLVIDQHGLIVIANLGSENLAVFGTNAAGDTPPLAVSPLPANAWDADYDTRNDRLYVALVDGDVAVFDRFVADGLGTGGPDRLFTPSDGSTKISINLHGIVVDAFNDRIVLSDVGLASVADDGQLFVIEGASTASGLTEVSRRIVGPATLLGNPVDIILEGTDLRVAEKALNYMLVFRDIYEGPSGDVAPDLVVPMARPEALAFEDGSRGAAPDVSDLSSAFGVLVPAVIVSSNDPVGNGRGEVLRLNATLQAIQGEFYSSLFIESATMDTGGDLVATWDNLASTEGGLLIASRAVRNRDGMTSTPSRDRTISGPATGLISPKGVEVISEFGLVLVAENNPTSPGVLGFSLCAAGDVAPIINLGVGGRPWAMDYDPITDALYVALTNGRVSVFDDFSHDFGAGGITRTITPTDTLDNQISINLHGIDYDAATDTLLLSDVGLAGDATDGILFVIAGASVASGPTVPVVHIEGPDSMLGNPVDIAFDGRHLYVAEKANNFVGRWDDILTSPSGDIAPSVTFIVPSAESVALAPLY